VGKSNYHRPQWDKQKSADDLTYDSKKEPVVAERKLGPRDYGTNTYQGAEYEKERNNGAFLEERLNKKKDGTSKVEKKSWPS